MAAGRWFAHALRTVVAARHEGRPRRRRGPGRAPRPVVAGLLLAMALATAIPPGVVHDGPGAGFPLHLPSWLLPGGSTPKWGRDALRGLPKQHGAGKPAKLSAAQLDALGRADRGAGHPAGKGIGATPPYQAPVHHVEQGKSPAISGPGSFNAATSKLVPAKGSADSELYQNADGSFTRRQYSSRVNVKAADGTWQRIDANLVADGNRLRPKVSAADVSMARTADDPQLVTLRNVGGGTFGYSLQGAAKVPGVVKGDTVTYAGVQPGVDLELRATGDGVKENLLVASAAAGNAWVFPLSLDNLTARAGAAGAIELVGRDGSVVARIPSGIVHDSKFDRASGGFEQATEAHYEIVTAGGRPALRVSVDPAWLSDPARVYPVVVDPTVTASLDATVDTDVRNDRSSDQSGDTEMSIGNNGSGVKAYSFLKFSTFYNNFANVNVTAATLYLYDSWAWTCTPKSFEINPVTQGWSTGALAYPGPSFGSAIGSVTPSVPNACANTGGNRSIGDWVSVGLSTGTFNNWARNIGNNGLAITTSQTDDTHWKKFTTSNYGAGYTPFLQITYQIELPVVTGNLPAYGYASPTLTPELQVMAYDPDHAPNASLTYTFVVKDKNGATVWQPAAQASPIARVPAGLLKWGETYTWIAYANDGANNQLYQDWYMFTTPVPQPDVTSTLSQNGDLGYEPSVRNYTTSATDANVNTVGPALTVERSYNSLDPRTNSAFGAGWSSLFDLSVTEVMSGDATPVVATVTVRYPAGQEIAFGRNPDGSFVPPPGRYATFTSLGAGAGYKLVDKDGTTYLFTSPLVTGSATTPYTWGITSITDSSDRTETLHYTDGRIDTVTSASGRSLHVTWSATGGTPSYTETSGTATFVDQTDDPAATVLGLTGDDVTTQVTLPFTFPLYGQGYTDARVSTNGTIAFDAFAGLSDGVNSDIPSTAPPNAALYPFWDDFEIDANSKITTKTSGTAPNRVFSIEWYNAYLFGRSTRVTVKAALAENGMVTYSYNDIDSTNSEDQGASAVVGIENATGTAAVKHSFHQPVLSSNLQITYTPTVVVPPGAPARIATVSTDPAVAGDPGSVLTWSYTYDANGQLQKVCPPTSATACHTYTYGTSSLYQSAVMNLGPRAYWRLGDASGATAAASEVIENQGTDNGTYGYVALGGASPLPAANMTSAAFNGTSSYVSVPPKDLPLGGGYQSISMWFKAASGDKGVLYSLSKDGVTAGTQTGGYNPALYIGTSGKLYGELWMGSAQPIPSLATVNDGNWHHVVLAGAGATQWLYVDNVLQGSRSGAIDMLQYNTATTATVGAGWWGGTWPDEPSANGGPTVGWFKGSIAEVASFDRPLTPANIASIYRAGTTTARPLTGVVRPSGGATATIAYEPKDSTVTTLTDSNGGTWKLSAPTTQGSSKVYASAVLASTPADYYRFAEGPQAQAINEVNGNPAVYNNVTLGVIGGVFDDSTVAQFDGWTSYVTMPDTGPGSDVPGAGPWSASMWIKTPTGSTSGGVLLGGSNNTFGTETSYIPHLYVGTDGKLRAGFWANNASLVLTSPGVVNDGNWHHVAVSAKDGDQRLFVDGAQVATGTGGTMSAAANTHVSVGAGRWGNYGTVNWAPKTAIGWGWGAVADAAVYGADLDGDGRADLVSKESGSLYGFRNCGYNSDGTVCWSAKTLIGSGWSAVADAAVKFADMDGDGRADLVSKDGEWLYEFRNNGYNSNGTITWGAKTRIGSGWSAVADAAVTLADLDGDRRADLVSKESGSLYGFRNCGYNSDGTVCWNAKTAIGSGWSAVPDAAVKFADLDGDHRADLVSKESGTLYGFHNDGYNTAQVWAGAANTTIGYFNGMISDVAYFRAALSPAAIGNQFNARPKSSGAPVKIVTVLDPKDRPLTYTFDLGTGRKVAETDTLGNETRYGYSDDGFLRTTTDPLGNVTTNEHDVRGNTVSTTTCQVQKNNVCSTVYFEYFPAGGATNKNPAPDRRNDMLLTQRDGRSSGPTDDTYKTSFAYDTNGNRTSATDPLGRTTTTDYTSNTPAFDTGNAPNGLQKTVTMPSGASQTIQYYHNGDVAQVTDPAGKITRYTYDNLGRILTQLDITDTFPSGIGSTFTYDGQNRVVTQTGTPVTNRVTGAVHTTLTTTGYDDDGHVLSQVVSDPTGGDASRTMSSTYNAHGQTESETAGGKTTTYQYDVSGDMVQETDPDGGITTNEYDAEHRLTATKVLNYRGDPNSPSDPATLTVNTKAYDGNGRLVLETDTMGFQTIHKYTDNGLEAQIIRKDPSTGAQFVEEDNSFDAAGNVVKSISDNGTSTTTYALDRASRVTGSTLDPAGINRVTTVSLSPDDHPIASVVTDGNTGAVLSRAENTYDELGRQTSQTTYNGAGLVPVARWKLDETSGTKAADSAGNAPATVSGGLTWSTDHPPNSTSAGSAVFSGTNPYLVTNGSVIDTTNSYTIALWVKTPGATVSKAILAVEGEQESAPLLQYLPDQGSGAKWSLALRPFDNQSVNPVRATAPGTVATNTWTHLVAVYDADAKQAKLYVDNGTPTTVSYAATWKAKGILAIGRGKSGGGTGAYFNGSISDVQVYSRALSASEITSVYNGSAPAAGATVNRVTSKLDKGGLAVSTTDPLGNVTDNAYDEAGRPSVVTGPAVQTETGGGTPISTRPVTYYGYDTFGLRTHVEDPNGNVTRTTYDSAGRVLTTIAPSYTPPGSSTPITPVTTRTYDDTGQLTKVTDALNHDTSYYYDQLGRVSKTVAADTGTTWFSYDLNGDQLTVTDPTGATTSNTYDYLARKVTTSQVVRQESNHYDTTFEYGTDGKLAKTTSPTGVTQQLTYNAAGDVVTAKDGAGNTTTTTYDAAGRPTKTTLADGSYSVVTYDLGGRPVKDEEFASGGGAALTTTSQAYDRAGNVTSRTDARGTTVTFTYDAAKQLTSQTQPVDTVAANNIVTTFGYDPAGNRTRFTDGRGNAFITTYNAWNLPESQIEPATTAYPNAADRTFTVAYDALARPAVQTEPGGVTITNTYNEVGKLTQQTGAGAEVATVDRTFGYDLAGRLTSTSASGGSDTFTYDDRGLLTSTSGASGTGWYTYKHDGQLDSRMDAAGTTTYSYDSAGRLDTIANTSASVQAKWTYDNLNEPKTVTYGGTGNVRTFTYDNLHRLHIDELKTAGGTSIASITYGWDNNGNETSKSTTGFGGTVANTYTYDLADRLTSWNNGTATTNYTYDKSGNRTGNGSATFTYDQRNQLTTQSGGITYAYTPRGTLQSTTSAANGTLATKTDAFGQVVQQYSSATASQSYTYDGLGRQTKTGLSYTGLGNDLAGDGTATYTRDPDGRVIGVKGSSAQYAFTDRHDDITGLFTATGTTMSGTTVYDPLGKVLATTGMQGSLGYQSEWTDTSTGRVNMLARWYNTDTGQFDTRDTADNSPVPNSVDANRYAYGNDNPLTTTDPTGHWGWGSIKNAWHATTNFIKEVTPPIIYNTISSVASAAIDLGRQAVHSVENFASAVVKVAAPVINAGRKYVANKVHAAMRKVNNGIARARQLGKAAAARAMKVPIVKKIADAGQAAVKFVKEHKNQIIEGLAIVGGIAAGLACTAATGGVGAVACMVGASALINVAKDAAEGNIHSWKDALGSAGTGALQGLAGAAGGYLGGVVGGKVACWAANKLGGMAVNALGKVAAGAISGGLSGAVSGAISDVVSQVGTTGRVDWGSVGTSALIGGITGAFSGGRAGKASPCGRHSFDPQTRVLMADGSTKKIEDVKLGDEVAATDPDTGATQSKPVTKLWLNHDTELTDVTVRVVAAADAKPAAATTSKTSQVAKAGAALVAAAAAVVGITTTVLHTTQHHPFWDRTTNTWVNAADLRPGDELKTDDGSVVQVTDVHNFTAAKDMRDLTVADVHTYYVLTADQPVLVHNVNQIELPCGNKAAEAAEWVGEGGFQNTRPPRPSTQSDEAVYESQAVGSRSGMNGQSLVPRYSAEMPDGSTVRAKFDSAFGDEAIDRKLKLVDTPKAEEQAQRQSVVSHFNGVQAVYELPHESNVADARRLLDSWGITNIKVRWAPWQPRR